MRIVVFLYIVFISYIGLSQKPVLAVSKNPVLVGEPFEISILVETTQTVSISKKWDSLPFRMKNDKGIFEITPDKFEITNFQEVNRKNNQWKAVLNAVIWDSGTFVLPPLKFNIGSNTSFVRLFTALVAGGAADDLPYDAAGGISVGGTYFI